MSALLTNLKLELDQICSKGEQTLLSPTLKISGTEIEYRGQRLINFASWDLFGLGNNPELKRLMQSQIELQGIAVCAPRGSCGTTPQHLELEERLARFLGQEAALLFSSKNQAVLSLLTAVLGESSLVATDDLVQSPIQDAAYLVNGNFISFPILDQERLNLELDRARKNYSSRFLVVESYSPLTGLAPDLNLISESALKYGAELIVDESFALGVFGLRGAGGAERYALKNLFAIYGALNFALCGFGGFVSGSRILIDYLTTRSRSFLLENPLPSACAALNRRIIELTELQINWRESLLKSVQIFLQATSPLIAALAAQSGPIVSIPFPSYASAKKLSAALLSRGFFVEALPILRPLSAKGVVRIIINMLHNRAEIEALSRLILELYPRVIKEDL